MNPMVLVSFHAYISFHANDETTLSFRNHSGADGDGRHLRLRQLEPFQRKLQYEEPQLVLPNGRKPKGYRQYPGAYKRFE